MQNLIDKSFFVLERNIPNTDDIRVEQRLDLYIAKLQKRCLQKLFGKALYDLIEAESSTVIIVGGSGSLLYRPDEQIQVGVTSGLIAGANTFTFDGTGGTPNYIGMNIVPSELTGRGIMIKDVDYSFDSSTGKFTLLKQGDIFKTGVYYNIHFEYYIPTITGTTPTTRMTALKVSGDLQEIIAYYVYYHLLEDDAEQTTGINTSVGKSDTGINVSPEDKMLKAWNLMADLVTDLLFSLWKSGLYPEFMLADYVNARNYFRRNNSFGF